MADSSLAVLGAGSWGTALAIQLARNGARVLLWGHVPEEVAAIARNRENRQFLPGIKLPDSLTPESNLATALHGADQILVVVPSHAVASVCGQIAAIRPGLRTLSWATKGYDPGSGRLLSQVAADVFPDCDLAVISGPTFASEVARGLPTAITVASNDPGHADRVAGYLDAGEAAGAKVLVDGRDLLERPGYFLGCSLLDHVTPEMSVWTDEIFGPVLSVVRVDTYEEALAVIKSVCAALDFAHEKGVIHRDLKPANILLKNNKIKIADFGFAMKASDSKKYSSLWSENLLLRIKIIYITL